MYLQYLTMAKEKHYSNLSILHIILNINCFENLDWDQNDLLTLFLQGAPYLLEPNTQGNNK